MINKVFLIGRIGKDPETRNFDNGSKVANFSLATSESYRKDDEWHEKTEWHDISCWGKWADYAEGKIRKGQLVWLEGKLSTRSWEQDGQKKYRTEVRVSYIRIIPTGDTAPKAEARPGAKPEPAKSGDDLPF